MILAFPFVVRGCPFFGLLSTLVTSSGMILWMMMILFLNVGTWLRRLMPFFVPFLICLHLFPPIFSVCFVYLCMVLLYGVSPAPPSLSALLKWLLISFSGEFGNFPPSRTLVLCTVCLGSRVPLILCYEGHSAFLGRPRGVHPSWFKKYFWNLRFSLLSCTHLGALLK